MCPRSVALPRFSRTTHTARAAKRSNFSYSECCTTGHRPTASRYNTHHHRCRASATALSVSSSIKVINHSIFINTINPKYNPVMSSHNQLSSLTQKIGSAANRFSKELVTYSPNHALHCFPFGSPRNSPGSSTSALPPHTTSRKPAAASLPRNRCAHDGTAM